MRVRFVKPEQTNPARDRGITVPYAPGKRKLARWRWYIILLIASSPLIYFVGKMMYASVVIEAPGFLRQQQITVRAMAAGYISDIYVKPLQEVKQGQPLARIANQELAVRASQVRAELRELDNVKEEAPSPVTTTVNYQDELALMQQQRDQAAQRMDQLQQLVNQGAATEAELNSARTQYNQAASKIAELYRTMQQQQIAQNQPNSAGTQIRTRVAALRAELANVSQQMDGLMIRAPTSGRLVDLPVVKGDQLAVGGKLAMIAPRQGELHIATYIPPAHGEYAAVGQRATVVFPDGSRRTAEVTDVPEVAQQVPLSEPFGGAELGVLVRMDLVDSEGKEQVQRLTDGLPVRVRFQNQWGGVLPEQVAAKLHHYWDGARDHLKEARAQN